MAVPMLGHTDPVFRSGVADPAVHALRDEAPGEGGGTVPDAEGVDVVDPKQILGRCVDRQCLKRTHAGIVEHQFDMTHFGPGEISQRFDAGVGWVTSHLQASGAAPDCLDFRGHGLGIFKI